MLLAIRARKKNPVQRAKRFQKVFGRLAQFFLIYFFLHFVAKITQKKLKNHDFFLAYFTCNFSFKFLSKKQLILQFFCLKKRKYQQMGKKELVAPIDQGFFSLAQYLFFSNNHKIFFLTTIMDLPRTYAYISAEQNKNTVCTFIKHSRYFH